MLKIRLTRRGKKNKAFYRIVVAEHTATIQGRFLEVLGFLDPHSKEKSFKAERIKKWLEKGAQCSDTVHNLLVKEKIVDGPKRAVKMKKKEVEKTEEAKPAETKKEPASAPEKPEEKKKTEVEKKQEEKTVPEKSE